jgi:hypothetical protein
MRIATSANYTTVQHEDLSAHQLGSTSPYSPGRKKKPEKESHAAISKMSTRMFDQLAPTRRTAKTSAMRGDYKPAAHLSPKPAAKAKVMLEYARGPVGFLQWLAVVHPELYDGVRKKHPELLVQAHEITSQIEAENIKTIPACPGCSSALAGNCSHCVNGLGHGDVYSVGGLGFGMDSLTNWVTNASGIIGNLANTYSQVRTATARPQIQAQLTQASAAQPPVNYGNPPQTPPGGAAVTSAIAGFGNMGMAIGVGALLVVGGIVLLKKRK